MNEQLNKKLAAWAGITQEQLIDWVKYPDDGKVSVVGIPKELYPNFPNSLDACFKWLVPKLFEESFAVIITQDLARACAYVRPLQFGKQFDAVDNHNPALALCLAIEKLIK